MKSGRQALLVFAFSAAAFILLRSRDFFWADGSLRCLSVYRSQSILFHPNNHMLYPVNVLLWSKLLAMAGVKAAGPADFVLLVALMNCLAAGGVLAIVSWLILLVTESRVLSLAVPLALGLTISFLAQATNANEPMVAVFWSVLGVFFAVQAKCRNRVWPLAASGFFFALALASYRSAVLLGPGALVVLLAGEAAPDGKATVRPRWRWRNVLVFLAASAIPCAAIFGWAYGRQGIPLSRMFARFMQQDDTRAYLSFNGAKLLNAGLGLVRNCFPVLPGFVGFRAFLAGPKLTILLAAVLCGAVFVSLLVCGLELVKNRKELTRAERIGALASFVGFLFTLIPVLIWEPHYGKLWLQPLICLSLVVAIALNRFLKRGRSVSILAAAAGILFILGAACNLSWAVQARTYQPVEFERLGELERAVGDQDLVVGDWSSLSVLFGLLNESTAHSMPFIDEAVLHGAAAVSELDRDVARTQAAGGKVFFLGLLDVPKPTWDSFLGRRCGVPYEGLQRYRAAARPRAAWVVRNSPVVLWEVGPADLTGSRRGSNAAKN